MNITKVLAYVVVMFAVSLIVTAVVSALWNLIFHGAGTIDWVTSFRFAILFGILFGILLPWIGTRRSRKE